MSKTAKEVLKQFEVDSDTWRLHEQLNIRRYCCENKIGEGLGDVPSLYNVATNVDHKKLLILLETSREATSSGPLWTDEQRKEFYKDVEELILSLKYLASERAYGSLK